MLIDALSVLCAQLTRDLLAIAKFLLNFSAVMCSTYVEVQLNVSTRQAYMTSFPLK